MTLRSTVRALKPLQALQICCGLSAAASRCADGVEIAEIFAAMRPPISIGNIMHRAFSRGNGANSVRPRFLSSVTAHPQTLTLLSKYVAFDHVSKPQRNECCDLFFFVMHRVTLVDVRQCDAAHI
mgnify:CR=1 FL=1